MKQSLSINKDEMQELILRIVKYTRRNVLLTGAGGTGKSTFLRKIHEEIRKRMVVGAPTSIAAINVGGSTLHSLFQIPQDLLQKKAAGNYAPRLQAFSGEKRALLEAVELLVIDEISMVRADVFEAVDEILRLVRSKPDMPFGGVQLLLMGDLYQLPPVLTRQENSTFMALFKSPYFFGSAVEAQLDLVKVELVTNYRQATDQSYLAVLNRIRDGSADATDMAYLNAAGKNTQAFSAESITLTTHHAKAAAINQRELSRFSEPEAGFDAIIRGEFPEGMYPVEKRLLLKPGVPVIFLKNDGSGAKRYFNGERATITHIEDGKVVAKTATGELLNLEREIWRNVAYTYDQNSHSIKEKVLGEFEQFPVQLAWAMTIHKSQGLTFEQATIDCSDAFSPGQLYVALSRLRSFDGLTLSNPVDLAHMMTDDAVMKYLAAGRNQHATKQWVEVEIRRNLHQAYLTVFAFSSVKTEAGLTEAWIKLEAVSLQFKMQLSAILEGNASDKYATAAVRIKAAIEYFKTELLRIADGEQATVVDAINEKRLALEQLEGLLEQVRTNQSPEAILDDLRTLQGPMKKAAGGKSASQKGTKRLPYERGISLLKESRSLDEIAMILELKPLQLDQLIIDSIRSRTVRCVDFLEGSDVEKVRHILRKNPNSPMNVIRGKLAEEIPTRTIKFVMAEFHGEVTN
jgi:hypothetical protein